MFTGPVKFHKFMSCFNIQLYFINLWVDYTGRCISEINELFAELVVFHKFMSCLRTKLYFLNLWNVCRPVVLFHKFMICLQTCSCFINLWLVCRSVTSWVVRGLVICQILFYIIDVVHQNTNLCIYCHFTWLWYIYLLGIS